MKQPEIGKTVTSLRLRKGMTQEKLAELCEVSARTIQRIESGEVDPRAYTLNNLGRILEFDFREEDAGKEIFWVTLLHLSSIVCIVIIPLLIWSFRKRYSMKIDEHGRSVLNFQITMTILLFGFALLYLLLLPAFIITMEKTGGGSDAFFGGLSLVGLLPMTALGILCFFQGIRNALRTVQEKSCRYLLSVPFLK